MSLATTRESEGPEEQESVCKLMTPFDSLLDSLKSEYRQYELSLDRASHDGPRATKRDASKKAASTKRKVALTEPVRPAPTVRPAPSRLEMIEAMHREAEELRKRSFRRLLHCGVSRYPPSWRADIESNQESDRRPRWSDRLTPVSRVLLAKALVIIRREKNLMRRAALVGETTVEGR